MTGHLHRQLIAAMRPHAKANAEAGDVKDNGWHSDGHSDILVAVVSLDFARPCAGFFRVQHTAKTRVQNAPSIIRR
jgi:hypothetical protein